MTNLNAFIEEQKKTKENVNDAFYRLATEKGMPVNVGHEDRQVSLNQDYFRAVEVTESFADVLAAFDATMSPSFKELSEFLDKNDLRTMYVTIACEGKEYTVDVAEDMLSNRLSLWLDMNQLIARD